MSRSHAAQAASALLIATVLATLAAAPVGAQDGVAEGVECVVEVEPNDSPELAPSHVGELCVQGTLVEVGDVDQLAWEVEEAGLTIWAASLQGVPGAATTAQVLRIDSEPEAAVIEVGEEVLRIETVPTGTEPATAEVELAAGRYLVAITRADPAEGAELTEDVGYELRIAPATEPSAGDATGRITVLAVEGASVPIGGDVAVELILDTSASMREPLGESTRIKVAQDSLIDLVDTTLPEGTPVALRTFRGGERKCGSRLNVPLAPLDRAAMTRKIRDLQAKKGTETPLAAAIAQVPKDLASVDGHRLLVVVTDGKEDCGGDPAAAIEALAATGTSVTVNLVGYSLDDEALKDEMAAWAALGGGAYLDAPDKAGLEAALAAALRAPYLVIDETGAAVARGVVGDGGVEVSEGVYRVEVLSDPPVGFDAVVVEASAPAELTVGEAP